MGLQTDVSHAPRPPGQPAHAPLPLDGGASSRPVLPARAVTLRSVVLGSLAVCLVCGLTPFNDYVVANTFLVGGYLPLVVVTSFFVLIVCVNAPLHRLAPRRALGAGELAVVMAMMLVSCGLPSQGLMRSFIPLLVAPFYHGNANPVFWKAFTGMDLPSWLFPIDASDGDARSSPIVQYFYSRVPDNGPIPWSAWVAPLAAWGVFFGALFATLVALATIVREQWARNERLAFPLAQLELALIEPPPPGRMFNDLFRSRVFWIGLTIVFVIQSLFALHVYLPKRFPEIPIKYDFNDIFTEEPLRYLHGSIKANTLYFTFVGATFFIQSRIAFSLWSTFVIIQLYAMQANQLQREAIPAVAWTNQHFGSAVAFLLGFAWIGRHHWAKVGRHLVRGARPGERMSYRGPALTAAAGIGVMFAWLVFVGGVAPWMAAALVALLLLVHVVTARVVAETGVAAYRTNATSSPFYTLIPPAAMSGRDVLFAGMFGSSLGAFTTRETTMTYALHGLWVADHVEPSVIEERRGRRALLACVAWALALGFVVAATSSLWCYYRYAIPLTAYAQEPYINSYPLTSLPYTDYVAPVMQHAQARFPPKAHSTSLNFGLGFGITAGLQVLALRYSAWPFMPVGYLFATTSTFPNVGWYSIFVGWLCKVVIVKFGGASLFQRAKPFFVGIIFGEGLAAACWLIVNLVLAARGIDYRPLNFLPT